MKVLITGGAGFIGKWIVEKLPIAIDVIILDLLDPQVHKMLPDFSPELRARAICLQGDIQAIAVHRQILEGIDVIIHLAAQTGTGQSMYEISKYVQHNANGTARLLELVSMLDHKPKRIILASSRAVYGEGAYTNGQDILYPKGRRLGDLQQGIWDISDQQQQPLQVLPMHEQHLTNPTSIYGLTKLWQEQLLQNYCDNHEIDLVILRFQNVYGPKQELGNPYTGIIGIFTNAVTQNRPVELFEDGLMTRDFVFVSDVADVVCKCMLHEQPITTILNVGSGSPTTLRALVETIAAVSNQNVSLSVSGRFRVGDIRHAVSDMSCYEMLFGPWQPTSLQAGLAQYLEWYLQQTHPTENTLKASLAEMEQKGMLQASQGLTS
jgi:dTDP-L-rhamnose 4-epimerase